MDGANRDRIVKKEDCNGRPIKVKCITPPCGNSGHAMMRFRGVNGEPVQGEGEVVKPMLWNVDIDEYGTGAEGDEDAQSKALRLLRFEILYMACNMKPSPDSTLDKTDPRYQPSPDFDTVQACRLVCRDWNDEISAIFLAVGKPLMTVNPSSHLQKRKIQITTESVMEVLNYSIVRPTSSESSLSDLSFPPLKLKLPNHFFYKSIENQFIHSVLPFLERYVFELHCKFPADATMKYYWPTITLDNLRKLKINCTNLTAGKFGGISYMNYNPFQHGNYMNLMQQIFNGASNLESLTIDAAQPGYVPDLYRLHFPLGVAFLDVPLVKMQPEEVTDCLRYNTNRRSTIDDQGEDLLCPRVTTTNMKHLIIRCPLKTFRRDENYPSTHASYLLEKYGSTLEQLELVCSGQEMDHLIWTMRRDYVYEPLIITFPDPLKKLSNLTLHAGNWEISGFTNYQTTFPSLKSLVLTMILTESQIRNLYETRCETVEKLKVSFVSAEMPYEVVRGFADNFPNLKRLEIILKESHPGLHLCVQKFPKLKALNLVYTNCSSDEGKDVLNSAVTGIPVEDLKALAKNEMTILDAMSKHYDNPSMRDLRELEEFRLSVRCNSSFYKLDISTMLRTTFLRMPSLKLLILTDKSIMIEDDQKDYIRKENLYGLSFKWE